MNMNIDEGYIKFNCIWNKADFDFPEDLLSILNTWRDKLYTLNLIGAYEGGIGFGNISVRTHGSQFIITGSATGDKAILTKDDYALVTLYNINKNEVESTGQIKASSEAMSHAALYESDKQINAVIHIHHLELWEKLLHKVPTTDEKVTFGTPEMAYEMIRLYNETNVPDKKIIVMGGHKEGIISFDKNLYEAGEIILRYYHDFISNKE